MLDVMINPTGIESLHSSIVERIIDKIENLRTGEATQTSSVGLIN